MNRIFVRTSASLSIARRRHRATRPGPGPMPARKGVREKVSREKVPGTFSKPGKAALREYVRGPVSGWQELSLTPFDMRLFIAVFAA